MGDGCRGRAEREERMIMDDVAGGARRNGSMQMEDAEAWMCACDVLLCQKRIAIRLRFAKIRDSVRSHITSPSLAQAIHNTVRLQFHMEPWQ